MKKGKLVLTGKKEKTKRMPGKHYLRRISIFLAVVAVAESLAGNPMMVMATGLRMDSGNTTESASGEETPSFTAEGGLSVEGGSSAEGGYPAEGGASAGENASADENSSTEGESSVEESSTSAEGESSSTEEGSSADEEETTTEEETEEETTEEETEEEAMLSLLGLTAERLNGEVSGNLSLNSYAGGGEITLTGNVNASGVCQLTGKLTIDLNGHSMTMANGASFMLCSDNAVLTIKDSGRGGIVYASGQMVWIYQGGTFNLYGGTLDGSCMAGTPQFGGCVWMARSNMGTAYFNMYGGTIQNFKASQYGGAVYVASTFSGHTPVFTMYGGTIQNCHAQEGAAVYVDYNGDGPGYFYIKGGTKQADGGESKAVIKCADYNGTPVKNAIFNYGYLGMEGVVDIDGIVYLNQNNWADAVTHFIKITGRLVVEGDGYIDIDSAYPGSNQVCTGHTVVENATQTEGKGTPISREEFYTYNSYFINSTKGLMVSAGFDPTKQTLTGGGPANWPSYQADFYSSTYTYVDVMGQTLIIQASDSYGDKRTMQNYDYLIYTERKDKSEEYTQYYSIRISKRDMDTGNALDGAVFELKRKDTDETIGWSGQTGDASDGVLNGETYLYLGMDKDGKLMIADGTYVLVETSAPDNYIARGELAVIEVKHEMDADSGQMVSVVKVSANSKVLSTEEQVINSTYGDKGWLVNREVVLYLNNTKETVEENVDYKLRIEKYQDEAYTLPLSEAEFTVSLPGEEGKLLAKGKTDEAGAWNARDVNGSEFTFAKGDSFVITETSPPEEYYRMEDAVSVSVDEENKIVVSGKTMEEGVSVTMADTDGSSEHGGWKAEWSDELLTLKIYDEKMPPTWTMQARKYGTKQMDALALAGAKFTLYRVTDPETEEAVVTLVSSDGTDGKEKGTLSFVDEEGNPMEFACGATYVLREIQTPLGYTLMEDLEIVIEEDGSGLRVTQNGQDYSGASYDAENRILTLTMINEAVYHMPQTGGYGLYPLTAGASALMGICLCTFFWLFWRRKETDGAEHSGQGTFL